MNLRRASLPHEIRVMLPAGTEIRRLCCAKSNSLPASVAVTLSWCNGRLPPSYASGKVARGFLFSLANPVPAVSRTARRHKSTGERFSIMIHDPLIDNDV